MAVTAPEALVPGAEAYVRSFDDRVAALVAEARAGAGVR